MAKRKRSAVAEASTSTLENVETPVPTSKPAKSRRVKAEHQEDDKTILDAANAEEPAVKTPKSAKADESQARGDPEAEDGEDDADPAEVHAASLRPPPVNSDYLPLPWKGRLGYACLNTYLRNSVPPVFSSRTTRIASILEHRHPLKDQSQPEHPTKNRPDKDKPADQRRGQQFVEQLCLANIRDMATMIRWNDRYGIKFLRLSSEAFPFASHAEYGYKLAPFAAEELSKVGKVAAELGHRLTTHPGQFTQLGSPRESVIEASFRDLEYHDEMLSLLKLPPQQDRDAVMILHMGGVFGDKQATLNRFRENYAKLSDSIKRRLVLENDDMGWSVHDLLPVCQELNIPFVLDWHHHNIIFDSDKIREGSKDVLELMPTILETWKRKGITPKMHYSEPTPPAITGKQRRKHSPRVASLPPCPDNMDLMIEAKDKEQAVLELMRNFKLPGWETFNNVVPHVRDDINKPAPKKKATPKKKPAKKKVGDEDNDDEELVEEVANGTGSADAEPEAQAAVPENEVGMGGPLGRVYWPPGMEDWLRPVKRVVKKKEPETDSMGLTPAQKKTLLNQAKAEIAAELKANKQSASAKTEGLQQNGVVNGDELTTPTPAKKGTKGRAAAGRGKRAAVTDAEAAETLAQAEEELKAPAPGPPSNGKRASSRATRKPRKSYREADDDE